MVRKFQENQKNEAIKKIYFLRIIMQSIQEILERKKLSWSWYESK